ncbi:hypothetical protein H6P81_008603 [Aristolochia fimbriata]|uniref:RING-type E3 ubiquitin transferase n=1 Tax=Aristolochia fimbriata TaxID=158543 RepID=A0AAV7EN36_ARIFI|nr:hypothetical protein H6P81_008603 [Aristolochia fimbriata]
MADLLLRPQDSEDEDIETLGTVPYWSHDFYTESEFEDYSPSVYAAGGCFFRRDASAEDDDDDDDIEYDVDVREPQVLGSSSESLYYDGEDEEEDQVSLILDLFDRSPRQNHLTDPIPDVDMEFHTVNGSTLNILGGQNDKDYSNSLDLGFELGLGSDDGEDDFFVRKPVMESGESSGNGLRAVGFESDSDEEEDPISGIGICSDREGDESSGGGEDLGLPLCWDCLRLEDRRDPNEDFEWEEVDDRVDEREVFSMVIDPDDERSDSSELRSDESTTHTTVEAMRTLDWEVLLAINNLDRTPTAEEGPEVYLPAHGYDFINTTEYEVLFEQFAEHENSLKGSPPTAKAVLDNLPSVLLTQEDVRDNNTLCAVCKDEISLEERAKKLPCSHHYHGDCIIPWLKIRNTCPVCRFELPTDDPDYENWKTQRGARLPTGDSQLRSS